MNIHAATLVVDLVAIYVGLGLLFAVPFVLWGAGRVDPVARESSWGFRLVVVPGVVALWPLLAKRWLFGPHGPPAEKNAHRLAAAKNGKRPA